MMGVAVQRRTIGASAATNIVGAGIGVTTGMLHIAAVMAAGGGPAGIVAGAVTAAASLIPVIMGIIRGCGQTCINDTVATEGAQMVYNSLWYALTGEDFGGFPGSPSCSCTAGQCGKMSCPIFDPQGTEYPNVPSGPLGYFDATVAMQEAQQVYQAARSKLVRQQSLEGLDFNFNGIMAKFQQVANAQAEAAAQGLPTTAGASDAMAGLSAAATSLFSSPNALLFAGLGILAVMELS